MRRARLPAAIAWRLRRGNGAQRLYAGDDEHARARALLAQGLDRRRLRRMPPGARALHARELEQHQARTAPVIPEARLFGEALRARWGISNWLDSLSNDVERIKDVLHSRSELLNSRHTAWFAGAALPLLFTIPLAAFTIAEYHDWKTVTGIIAGLILVNVLLFIGFLRLTAWLDRPPPGSAAP